MRKKKNLNKKKKAKPAKLIKIQINRRIWFRCWKKNITTQVFLTYDLDLISLFFSFT